MMESLLEGSTRKGNEMEDGVGGKGGYPRVCDMTIVPRLAGQVYGQGAKGIYDVGVGVFFLDGKGGNISESRGVSLQGRLYLEEVFCEERMGVIREL